MAVGVNVIKADLFVFLLCNLLLGRVKSNLADEEFNWITVNGSELSISCGKKQFLKLWPKIEEAKVARLTIFRSSGSASLQVPVTLLDLQTLETISYGQEFQVPHFETAIQPNNEGLIAKVANYTCTETEFYHCTLELQAVGTHDELNETVTHTLDSEVCKRETFDTTFNRTAAVAGGLSSLLLIVAVLIVLGVVHRVKRQSIDVIEDIEIIVQDTTGESTPSDFSPKYGEGRLYYVLKKKWREDWKRVECKKKLRSDLEEVSEKLHIWCSTLDSECH